MREAIHLFAEGKISSGKAAQMAGLSRAEFLEVLVQYSVSVFQESAEEIVEEAFREPVPADHP